MLMDLSRRGDFLFGMLDGGHSGGGGGGANCTNKTNMVEAAAQELGRMLKQYEADLATLLDDFASRYISSGAFGCRVVVC